MALRFCGRLKVESGAGWAAFGGTECRGPAGDDEVCAVSGCGRGTARAYIAAAGDVADGAERLHLATTNISCREGSFFDDVLYAGNNLMQRVGSVTKPFATGMFMLFDREVFWALGGFNEQALFAEDYLLSKGVARSGFALCGGGC